MVTKSSPEFRTQYLTQAAYGNPKTPDPLSVPLPEWISSLNINIVSLYAAAQEAVKGFRELPEETLKTFIFTGNCCPHVTLPVITSLSVGKTATANLIQNATAAYKEEGFRFVSLPLLSSPLEDTQDILLIATLVL